MVLRIVFAGLLTALAQSAAAQEAPLFDPALASRVDSIFAPYAGPGSPGCALGIVRDGVLVYGRGYGLASVELGVPITTRTVFDIGSTSKQITAASMLLLAQDGKLSLDDDVRRWVPELPKLKHRVTLRHLLTHTSGIRDYIDLLFLSGVPEEAVTGAREALEILGRQKALNFEPGSQYAYSNSGFFLASVVVERASGRSLRQFAAERIFRPLGMMNTEYVDDHTRILPGRAMSYYSRPGGGFRLAIANWEQTGDGAVNTTVEDLARWDLNFYSGEVGGPGLLAELQTPARLNDGKVLEYALGLGVGTHRGLRRVGHGGAWAGFRAELLRFPDVRSSIICLCNVGSSSPTALALRVADLVLADRLTAPVASSPPAASPARAANGEATAAAEYAGTYRSQELLTEWKVYVRADTLRFRIGYTPDQPLRSAGKDRFVFEGMPLHFMRDPRGRVTGIGVTTRGVRGLVVRRMTRP